MRIEVILELIGYTGSLLVVISMLMTSVVKLRVINTIGGVIFCVYALCIHSYPTAAMQLCLITINLINLYKLNNTKKEYSAVEVGPNDGFLAHFLFAHADDIKKYFPDFSAPQEGDKILLITCGENPAGVFIANEEISDKDRDTPFGTSLNVKLDYTSPAYRDCSAGKFLYNHLKHIGIKRLRAETKIPAHEKYLKKMGFSARQIKGDKNDSPNYYIYFKKEL